jgi:hypothetical protein
MCCRCKKRPVESIDGWTSTQCGHCNDQDIERANERREWEYYHPPIDDREPKPMTDKLTDLERELLDALRIAELELNALHNLRVTDLDIETFNAHLGNDVDRSVLEWITDNINQLNVVRAAIAKAEARNG